MKGERVALYEDPHWPRAGAWFCAAASTKSDIALLGIGSHLSAITANNSQLTPAAIREALWKYSTWSALHEIDFAQVLAGSDFGDVSNPDGDEREIARHVEESLAKTHFLIALGGDNSITFPSVMGFAKFHGGLSKIGLITIDAHHDLRDGQTNGSPIERLVKAGLPGENIVQIGISDFANSKFYASRAKEYGISVVHRSKITSENIAEIALQSLALAGAGNRPIFIDFDFDVCDRSVAPACPASTPGGISAQELRGLAFALTSDPRVKMVDITEIDSTIDSTDQRTTRLAALAILEMATAKALIRRRDGG